MAAELAEARGAMQDELGRIRKDLESVHRRECGGRRTTKKHMQKNRSTARATRWRCPCRISSNPNSFFFSTTTNAASTRTLRAYWFTPPPSLSLIPAPALLLTADALREGRDHAVAETARLGDQLAALRALHDRSVNAHASSLAEAEGRAAELRSEAKMRGFELAALGVSHEGCLGELREAKLEVRGRACFV